MYVKKSLNVVVPGSGIHREWGKFFIFVCTRLLKLIQPKYFLIYK